jgi:hypothetical protein
MDTVKMLGNPDTNTGRPAGRRTALADIEEKQLVHEYSGPAKPTAAELAEKYDVTPRTVFNILRRHRQKEETPGPHAEGFATTNAEASTDQGEDTSDLSASQSEQGES